MKLNALATIALFGGLVFASSSYSQPAQTGGPTPSPPGAKAEFLDLKDGAVIGPKTTIHFGLHGMGVAPAGTKKAEHRTLSSPYRQGSAALGQADPERRKRFALRRRPNRSRTHAASGPAHAAVAFGRRGPHPSHAARLLG